MQFSKFILNTETQAYEYDNTNTQEFDTSAQIRAYLETTSAPPEHEAEGCMIQAGNGGGIGVQVPNIQAIAVNGSVIVDMLPADN